MLKSFNRSQFISHILCLGGFGLLCIFTGPDNFRFPNQFLPDDQDTILAMALMSWPAHCIQSANCTISDFPIFYPQTGALFFTDSLIGIGLIFNSLKIIFSNQLSYNLTLLTLTVANYYSFFLLMRYMRIRYFASFLAATMFAMMPYLMQYGAHIQIYFLCFWPLSLIAVLKLFETRNVRWMYVIGLLLSFTFYFSMSVAIKQLFFILFAGIVVFVSIKNSQRKKIIWQKWTVHALISVFISGLLLFPLAYQYYLVRQEHPFIREIENSIPFSLDLIALPRYILSSVLPEKILNIVGMRPVDLQNYSDIAFSGFSTWMALFSCVIALKLLLPSDDVDTFRHSRVKILARISFASFLLSMVLMLGPYIVITGESTSIPSLYSLFYYFVPGFKALRVPVRFIVPMVLYAAILMGICLDLSLNILTESHNKYQKITAFFLTAILFAALIVDRSSIEYTGRKLALSNSSVPSAYKVVQANPDKPLLELPMWPPSPKTFKYFHYMMLDWNPRLGGISSFFPEQFYQLRGHMNSCPSQECFDIISKSKADILIVDMTSFNHDKQKHWIASDLDPYGFHLQEESDNESMVWLRIN